VGGIARLSTCDWPGELVATIFCQGCAWNCPYCHNPGLRPVWASQEIAWAAIRKFFLSRRGLLDGVVFSGGEPTLQPALLDAVREVRQLGFRVGMHSTGMCFSHFAELLPLLDWVGFDVKAPFGSYAKITGVANSGGEALESLRSLLASRVPYEVRTTLRPELLSLEDMLELKVDLLELGIDKFVVQRCRPNNEHPVGPLVPELIELPNDFSRGFSSFQIR
jgi:pyruvate formate lyase activating enzyme